MSRLTICLALCSALLAATKGGSQSTPLTRVQKTIDVYGEPASSTIKELRDRYGLLITYQDPIYACPCDLTDVTPVTRRTGPRLMTPKGRAFRFTYFELNGMPEENTATLLDRLGREVKPATGVSYVVTSEQQTSSTRWHVVPTIGRGNQGQEEPQPDLLDSQVFVPAMHRSVMQFLTEVLQQVTLRTQQPVLLGSLDIHLSATTEMGADHITAREALKQLVKERDVWDLFYDPQKGGRYYLNVGFVRPAGPAETHLVNPERPPARDDAFALRAYARRRAMSRGGTKELQIRLQSEGFYVGEPTDRWDPKTIAAVKAFQQARNLRITGTPNLETLRALDPYSGR